ncbi:hypothetical protein bsdcttw_49150 [Anaerocolumna chitinilytica]|uniref:Uncharacterized protein n=1 Tax=Anaerocolumna chitinilytica TaxID=1727145 RepID=A0A7M3SBA7_9FIRM|nr:hypothetical protein bsdcttw_49150 [Anaerocolumna chitinilytica]
MQYIPFRNSVTMDIAPPDIPTLPRMNTGVLSKIGLNIPINRSNGISPLIFFRHVLRGMSESFNRITGYIMKGNKPKKLYL